MNLIWVFFAVILKIISAEKDILLATTMDRFTVEGRVLLPEIIKPDFFSTTRILVNGGEYVGFLKTNGSFTVNNVASGSYVIEVANPTYLYEPIRVDINSRGKFRARKVNYIQSSHVHQLPYPLKFKVRGPFKYFQIRESWKVTDILFNPMVIMMVLPLLFFMLLPKMTNASDPDTQREIQQMQMPKYDVPELSELMASIFTGNKKNSSKSNKPQKKRQ